MYGYSLADSVAESMCYHVLWRVRDEVTEQTRSRISLAVWTPLRTATVEGLLFLAESVLKE